MAPDTSIANDATDLGGGRVVIHPELLPLGVVAARATLLGMKRHDLQRRPGGVADMISLRRHDFAPC